MSVSKLKGETWTKRTARSGFPILVEYVRNRWEITYGEWDAEIVRRGLGHHVMAVQYGYPAGAIGDACQQYADQTGTAAPPINLMVVNKSSRLPDCRPHAFDTKPNGRERTMPETVELGRIEKADLRDAWPHEAAAFTPWLADHVSDLGAALGLELELVSEEAPVGKFSLDLLARDTGTNRTVIIENQLEPTDHDHLGKLLTYAGGYDANVIVWIAKEFRDEHRQALDWLNQRTDEDTDFFGVVIEVWKIDGSRPGPHFNIVAAPNEWRREAVRSVRDAKASEKNLRYQAFFQPPMDALRARGFTNARKAQFQSWYHFSAGHAQRVQYGATFAQGEKARIEVYIDSTDKDWNKTLFDRLMERKKSIESELSESLEWQRLDDRRASRIAVVRRGSIDDDPETLKEIEDWMIDKLLDFKRVFNPRLNEFATNHRSSRSASD